MRAVACTLLTLLVLTGCGPDSPGKDDGGVGAEKMKQDVDAAVLDVVPRLESAFGTKPRSGPAGMFIECQMGQGWKYQAAFGLVVPADGTELDQLASALTDAGFQDVAVADGAVTGKQGEVAARASAAAGSGTRVVNVEIEVDCTRLDDADTTFAGDDAGTDYPELD
jgi:hypothetical protein